jgi:formyltetrahydrofolate hydrolase
VDSAAYTAGPGVPRWSGPKPGAERRLPDLIAEYQIERLVAIGRDVERLVLARAVRLYAEDRVVLAGARTVVFG